MIWIYCLFGLIIGGLVNYTADYFPEHMGFVIPYCKRCKAPQSIRRYFFLQKCVVCNNWQGPRSVVVVVFMGIISSVLYLFAPVRLGFFMSLLIVTYLLLISIIDIEHHLVLAPISIAGGVLFSGIGIYLHGFLPTLLGGLAGYLIMLGLYFAGILFSRYMNKRRNLSDSEPGMGKGDVSISAVLGLLLGWPGITAGLLLGILIGGGVGLVILAANLILKTFRPNIGIPYVPFLAVSTLILIFR